MVRVCLKSFPKGSYKGQRGDGYAMDGYLKENIDIMAKKIVNDMQFVCIVSGKGTVRNGKSTIAQQQAFYFNDRVNELHGLNNTFDVNNIVFKADDLIDKALKLPKYSVLILDEGDDLTAQYYSKLAIKLRRFFRKCGQLNLFIILLIPDFFELPRPYAVTRSTYLINTHFAGNFDRGFFEFYSSKRKRNLYYKGKRFGDYDVVQPDFPGRFPDLYTVDEELYREKKHKDLIEDNDLETNPTIRKLDNLKILKCLIRLSKLKKIKCFQKDYAEVMEVGRSTVEDYMHEIVEEDKAETQTYDE